VAHAALTCKGTNKARQKEKKERKKKKKEQEQGTTTANSTWSMAE
jgi:hypothetical protein